MTLSNIKQTVMKDYTFSLVNGWRTIGFTSPFYFAQLFVLFSALSIIFFAFLAKMATYSLVIDNVYFVISS